MRPHEATGAIRNAGHLLGVKLRHLATWVESWNEYESAMGLAAINSVLNGPTAVRANCAERLHETDQNIFLYMRDRMRGKNVAVIGHFPALEQVAEICNLSIWSEDRKPMTYPTPPANTYWETRT
jgi:hypothetical protein